MFKLKNAYYQSWMKNKNEKGTDICIELLNVSEGLEFKYIVFRKHKLEPIIEKNGNIIILKGVIVTEDSIYPVQSEATNLSNRIVYYYKGKEYSFNLKNIKRKSMNY